MGNSFVSQNSIYIQTSKPVYHAGDLLQGTIYLNIVGKPFNSRGVFLRIEGYEDVFWEESERERRDGEWHDDITEHRDRRHILHYKIPVYQFQGQLMPGQYTFPFSLQLPQHMTGSFYERPQRGRYNQHWEANVHYRLEAECDAQGWNWDIRHEQNLTIHERVWNNSQPQSVQAEKNVMYCCCCNQGSVDLTAHFQRDAYAPGEQAVLQVEVENKSKSDVNYLHGRLKRRVTIYANGRRHVETELLQDIRTEGVPAGETLLGGQAKQIVIPMQSRDYGMPQPSCNGQIVQCQYWLEVDCAISMAPDIAVELPVTVYAPSTQWQMPTAPPGWNPNFVMQEVPLQMQQGYAC